MSWYYTDWTWVKTLTTATEAIVLVGIILWAITEWARTFRRPHGHDAAVVKQDLARPARAKAMASSHHSDQNGNRAA